MPVNRMRPICERPTTLRRSISSKEPVALANAKRRRSRRAPSGRFISKMGARPTEVFQEAVRGGMVSEIARDGSTARADCNQFRHPIH
jgi:hypothetical protein